jgi:hypothetical protein
MTDGLDEGLVSMDAVFSSVEKMILLADGDRDHSAASALNCNQTMVALHLLRELKRRLESVPVVAATPLSEQERHGVEHARYQVQHASPDNPNCCFDYELVLTLVKMIDRAYPVSRPQQRVGKPMRVSMTKDGILLTIAGESLGEITMEQACIMWELMPMLAGCCSRSSQNRGAT